MSVSTPSQAVGAGHLAGMPRKSRRHPPSPIGPAAAAEQSTRQKAVALHTLSGARGAAADDCHVCCGDRGCCCCCCCCHCCRCRRRCCHSVTVTAMQTRLSSHGSASTLARSDGVTPVPTSLLLRSPFAAAATLAERLSPCQPRSPCACRRRCCHSVAVTAMQTRLSSHGSASTLARSDSAASVPTSLLLTVTAMRTRLGTHEGAGPSARRSSVTPVPHGGARTSVRGDSVTPIPPSLLPSSPSAATAPAAKRLSSCQPRSPCGTTPVVEQPACEKSAPQLVRVCTGVRGAPTDGCFGCSRVCGRRCCWGCCLCCRRCRCCPCADSVVAAESLRTSLTKLGTYGGAGMSARGCPRRCCRRRLSPSESEAASLSSPSASASGSIGPGFGSTPSRVRSRLHARAERVAVGTVGSEGRHLGPGLASMPSARRLRSHPSSPRSQ
jgi:hypothetical protein